MQTFGQTIAPSRIVLDGVHFSYNDGADGTPLFDNFGLTLPGGSLTVIVGASGSGKSTLLSLLAGVLSPGRGSIHYHGFGLKEGRPPIGFVFQNPALIPWRTVLSNVLFGLEIRSNIDGDTISQARKLLVDFNLAAYENRFPSELSGGMQQRVSVLRSIISRPSVLLFDEPFSNSDFLVRRALQRVISDVISHREILAVLVTHDLNDALRMGDRIIVIGNRPIKVLDSFEITIPRETRMSSAKSSQMEIQGYLERVWRNWD